MRRWIIFITPPSLVSKNFPSGGEKTPFVRIQNERINLGNPAYVAVGENEIESGFNFHPEKPDGQNFLRLERGTHLEGPKFEEGKEFVHPLLDPDPVILLS